MIVKAHTTICTSIWHCTVKTLLRDEQAHVIYNFGAHPICKVCGVLGDGGEVDGGRGEALIDLRPKWGKKGGNDRAI